MPIRVLDSETIDHIAAGEVVERPASVVKELVENAMDAGATAIAVDISEGGIAQIRVTDNGSGIVADELETAFLRHATSKISSLEDLDRISSLGFRGEALSSICAVSRIEILTKTPNDILGSRFRIAGGVPEKIEAIGAPNGTTIFVRNLFYNTPARRKFLKSQTTEGGYITDLMEHLALSAPHISFQYSINGKNRFHTSGNGNLQEVIYNIYGREISGNVIEFDARENGIHITGCLGKPALVRSNRNFEIYFINGRYVKSAEISNAIEEGYREYLMIHKFPFCVLNFEIDPETVDVNVHPTKMEVRISDFASFFATLSGSIHDFLQNHEMLSTNNLENPNELRKSSQKELRENAAKRIPQPFEHSNPGVVREETVAYAKPSGWVIDFEEAEESEEAAPTNTATDDTVIPDFTYADALPNETSSEIPYISEVTQTSLFDDRIVQESNLPEFRFIGQVFDTYWIIQYQDQMLLIDQHAAHEKINYERLMKQFHSKSVVSQQLMPPIIVTLTGREENVLNSNPEAFISLGFEIEHFGGHDYALRGVPLDLYGKGEKELILATLDELSNGNSRGSYKCIEEKIASMACKASIKGGDRISEHEAKALIKELLTLDNPYNCPHGRPTIITISRTEMEKKFKRIVD